MKSPRDVMYLWITVALFFLLITLFIFVTGPVPKETKLPLAKERVARIALPMPALEAVWTVGGEKYRNEISRLAGNFADKMDNNCEVAEFDVSSAVRAFNGFVEIGQELKAAAVVRAQVQTMACMIKFGSRAEARLGI